MLTISGNVGNGNMVKCTVMWKKRKDTIWKQNLARVTEHNKRHERGLETYTKGMNEFSDLTWEEFKDRYSMKSDGIRRNFKQLEKFEKPLGHPPSSLDWRSMGAVTSSQKTGD